MGAADEPRPSWAGDPFRGAGTGTSDDEVTSFGRSSFDLLRLALFGAAALVVALLTRYLGSGAEGLEEELSRLLVAPVDWMRATIDVLLIATVISANVAVLVLPVVLRRWRQLAYVLAAMLLAGVLFSVFGGWVGLRTVTVDPTATTEAIARTFAVNVAATAQLVAAFVTTGPFVGIRWRRLGLGIVAGVLVLQLAVVSGGEATHVLLVLTTGYAVASAVLLAFGRPTTRPSTAALLRILRRAGVPASSLDQLGISPRGTISYSGTDDDGDGLFVRVLGSDRLSADLLRRAYRAVRYRSTGDDRPFTSIRRSVEHEALCSFQARDAGVRTPRLRSLAAVGEDSFLVAYDRVDGAGLDTLLEPGPDAPGIAPDDAWTDRVLRSTWRQVEQMQAGRIAHRDLRTQNLMVDGDDEVWIVGLWQAEVAADDALLRTDLAQVLTSLALAVGPRRAVETGADVLGEPALAASLGRLQPLALTRRTRARLGERPGLLDELRTEVERRCGVEPAELEPLARIGPRQVFSMVMLVAVVYFLVPQFADLPAIFDQITDADWYWAIPASLASIASYLAAAIALTGAVPGRLPFGATSAAQLGTAFTSTVAPAGIGGMALNVRFLQRQGVDSAVATSSVGLDAVGGFLGHAVLLLIFVFWAGRDAIGDVELPSPKALAIGVGVVVAIAVLALLVPSTRRMVRTQVLPILGRAAGGLRDVLTTPSKIALMLGGSLLVTVSYLLAFVASAEAFDVSTRFATLGAVYLFGAAIATVAPTPGGIGATEAALIGGMVAVGVPNSQAVPAVFFFRLVTFWLPILPGWVAYTWLRRTDRL
ncbi:lysylphosphatidylglycerol synthase domain-containing protein [Dermatobacter hominis]|uniref:lysylphosphatidylglycerol synthase domain-containing protein n=1 Tax=Dermatobacter hominis TaxID=2884263 RepID=UPI001D13003E|nr:lysylphosphatidylglycerol synthase domain-containing protein [Dermatobacter hominis]UDY34480.1 flippase-like domain-containing protein [Dermatobacter hominis]